MMTKKLPGLNRRHFFGASAVAAVSSAFATNLAHACTASNSGEQVLEKRPIIIDALGGIRPSSKAIAESLSSGLTAINITLGYVAGPQEPFEMTVRAIGQWNRLIRKQKKHLLKVESSADIHVAHRDRKVGVIYGVQNAMMLGEDASRVATFADLGLKVLQLTYNTRNRLGDGATVKENRGLTKFGHEVVQRIDQNKILMDLSHSGQNLCLDALKATKSVPIISHSGCYKLSKHPRNKTDQELRLLAEKGGVVGIYQIPYLTFGRQSMAEDFVKHIEHAWKVCGEEHVGLGTDCGTNTIADFEAYKLRIAKDVRRRAKLGIGAPGEEGMVPLLPDMRGPGKFHQLIEMLKKRGHKQRKIEKLLGRNFLRVMGEVWDD